MCLEISTTRKTTYLNLFWPLLESSQQGLIKVKYIEGWVQLLIGNKGMDNKFMGIRLDSVYEG